MTNSHSSSEPDDRPIASLLKRLDHDAPSPDLAALDAIGVLAAAVFDDAGDTSEMLSSTDGTGKLTHPARREAESGGVTLTIVPRDDGSNSLKKNPRRHPMFTLLASRGLASLTAIVSTIALWFAMSFTSSSLSATPFSKVLSELQRADSMQLKIVRDGNSADVWIRSPGLVRYQESAQRYQIAAGSRLWKIDEASNTVEESDSPWFLSPQERIDLLSLLGSEITDATRLMNARPVEQTTRDGRDCLIYRTTLPAKNGEIDIEAAVDSKNLQLLEIAAWKPKSNRKGLPLAEMTLVALNVAVADEQFAVSKSLSEDGRIGTIGDAQGIVVLRPRLAKRWTPVSRETILQPGDWVRTEVRGANAVKVSLTNGVAITLGPGTLVECLSQTEARLHYGMVQVAGALAQGAQASGGREPAGTKADDTDNSNKDQGVDTPRSPEGTAFKLLAPREGQREIKPGESLILRTDRDEQLIEVAQKPAWLLGFEGASSNESLGSLIVTMPDGRNEPLTVGYHKVTVEIRDQIARTTIEESFVNHTASRLEGIFHFPLPQDASISGFGMWIGNDLVEADVVEKQRAREIYETILREKRDPGLLEWTSGNIFKARVFPIEAQSEKRVKIVYTQVLPLRSNKYRYSYGLRSELLRTKPLRELSLSVTVNSALALKKVTCPTHAARITTSENQTRRADAQPLAFHSAQVEFSAQEYSPSRDFEVVFEVDGKQNDVVVIPHQRGDDGYFLIQLTPPGTAGNWQREVLPDGEPLKLVLLCDTSMSMDEAKRRDQADFVAAVLASLGPDDQFQLVAADVATAWASDAMQPATETNIEAAKTFVADRVSLGWTNLDRAFEDVLSKVPANAHVVYVGDGLISAGDTDAPAFVKRLANLASGGRQSPDQSAGKNRNQGVDTPRSPSSGLGETGLRRTLHAVTVGNTNDSVVMRGIATVGGGSSRVISGEQSPQVVATELLNEIAQPGLRDLKIEFKGVKVAAVYPEQLPNVAAGTQQILVGRFLPEGQDQQGEVIVTGKRGRETVRYAARVDLKNAEDGNSFIPRLWARSHLDFLLAQGTNSAIQDDVIRLSEEFHIITPYTSLLVLETDADRERFGVKRRFEMRDGERFFAEGRANANFELLQQQMKLAGSWRLNLRRQILDDLSKLGRNPQEFGPQSEMELRELSTMSNSLEDVFFRQSGLGMDFKAERGLYAKNGRFAGAGGFGGGLGGNLELGLAPQVEDLSVSEADFGDLIDPFGTKADRSEFDVKQLSEISSGERQELPAKKMSVSALDVTDGPFEPLVGLRDSIDEFSDSSSIFFDQAKDKAYLGTALGGRGMAYGGLRGYYNQPDYTAWINTLFPLLPPIPGLPAVQDTEPIDRKLNWSPEAIELSKSLLRTERLQNLDGGVELRRDLEYLDPAWNRVTSRNSDLALYSSKSWATRGLSLTDQSIVNYCNATERGVYSLAFGLGRIRKSEPQELAIPPSELSDYSISSIQKSFETWKAIVEPGDGQQVRLVLTFDGTKDRRVITVDTERRVIVRFDVFEGDQLKATTTFEDFVQVADSWWARHVQTFDDKNRRTFDMVLDIQQHAQNQFTERMNQVLVDKARTQFLHSPMPRLSTARQKVADGTASFDDRMIMILHNARLQQWDDMWKHVDAAEQLAADKTGVRWIRTMLLATIRRHEEAKLRLMDEARRLVPAANQDEVFLAEFVLGQLNNFVSPQELYDVHQQLKPVYARPIADRIPSLSVHWTNDAAAEQASRDALARWILNNWIQREASSLQRLGKSELALAMYKSISEAQPWDVYAQQAYTDRAQSIEGYDVAEAWLRKEINRPERTAYDASVLRPLVFNLLKAQAKWPELLQWTNEWIATNPNYTQYYSAYTYHLLALIYNDQLEQVNALTAQWLQDARIDGELSPMQRQKLDAALYFLQGQLPELSFQRQDEESFALLAETAGFFAKHTHHFDIVNRAFANYYFGQSEYVDQLRGEWLEYLRKDAATIPTERLSTFISWTLSGRMSLSNPIDDRRELDASEIPDRIWAEIAGTLKGRWLKVEEKSQKQQISDALITIYSNRFHDSQLLPFHRERIASAANDPLLNQPERTAYIAALFEELLRFKWTAGLEAEAFTIVRQLSVETDDKLKLMQEIPAMMRLVDSMLANRISAGEQQLHDQGETDKLTRRELAEKKASIRDTAHKELSQRLAELAKNTDGPIADWFRMEQIRIDVGLGQNTSEIEAACWKILGDAPPKNEEGPADSDDDLAATVDGSPQAKESPADPKLVISRYIDGKLKARALAVVTNLTTRSKAEPASVERLIKFIDMGIANGGASAMAWRQAKFRLLVAMDRPEELERQLRGWSQADSATAPWRQMLARLLAERGQIQEAVSIFETCEKDKLLTAADYRALSSWYLVLDRRGDYERVQLETYRQMPEQHLAQLLYQTSNRWSRTDPELPSEVSDDTLMAIRVLLEKSGNPETYLHHINAVQMASRDFRLLKLIPDTALGRTAQQIYPILQSIQNSVLNEMRNEATADELMTRINELRLRKLTAVDQRALDLIEAMIERKSAEVLNQPGPHLEACVAAMKRSFEHAWSEGEPQLMASFLRQLGGLPHDAMKAEQLRQLRALQEMTPANSRPRLYITIDLCELLFNSYNDQNTALQQMEAGVRNYSQANNDIWPNQDVDVLHRYVGMLESSQAFSTAESLLKKHRAKPAHRQQEIALNERLRSLYIRALDADGAVSIGTGRTSLFDAILSLLTKDLATATDENQRYTIIVQMVDAIQTGRRHNLIAVNASIQKLAFEILPEVLKLQQEYYRETVSHPLTLIHEVLGKDSRLQYALERLEAYPQRFLVHNEQPWDTLGSELAEARQAVGPSDLDDRVLKLVLPQLRQYLTSPNPVMLTSCHLGHTQYWAEKADDFARLAEDFLAERRDSGRGALRVAQYLHDGLGRIPRAIEILLITREHGRTDENTDHMLVRWLRDSNRLPEAIGILESLVKLRPDRMEYQIDLMTACFAAQREQQLRQLIEKMDTHFHADGRWTESNAALFSRGCLAVNEPARARTYMTEAIVLHQRANPASGVNDATLSEYYQQLASIETSLGNTREAVNAAMSAITRWSSSHEYRVQAIGSLRSALSSAKDLDGLVRQLDAAAENTGQDNPILRKAIGQIYLDRAEPAKAITQLKLALELQPNDRETHQALIRSYDDTSDKAAAIAQLRKLIDLMPHDLTLYSQLADRLKDDPAQAERAATSIVESSPNEAEPHQAYAERLQSLNRWAEAIPHWQQVARYRKLEPTGLLKLAEAQLHEKQFDAAKATLKTLRSTMWPSRFGDVDSQIRNLENQLSNKGLNVP